MLLFLAGVWVLLSIVFGVVIGTAIRRADLAERSWRTPDSAVDAARSRRADRDDDDLRGPGRAR